MKVSTPIWLMNCAVREDFDARQKGGRQTQILEWLGWEASHER